MSLHHTSSQQPLRSHEDNTATLYLQGRTLAIARGLWVAWVIAVLALFFGTLAANFAYLDTVNIGRVVLSEGQIEQLTRESLRQLQTMGLSIYFYATFIIVVRVIFVLVWFMIGGVIFWRKSDERMALLAAFALVIFPIAFSGTITTAALPQTWQFPLETTKFLGAMIFTICLYVFPSGQFVPRWTPWLLIGWAIEESGVTFLSAVPLNPSLRSFIDGFLFIGLLASIIAVQVYRYRNVSTTRQRQQTKWVVYGLTVAISGFVATIFMESFFFAADNQSSPLANLIGFTLLYFFLFFIPLSIGFAILRSRLWDIDIIINRTLVYGTLSVMLVLIYFGLVYAVQYLLRGIINQNNAVAIVVSTLVIAALFNPLRHRIQSIIDRRFYRRKYDAAKTLAAFSVTLRNEVDVKKLKEELIGVVQETMQPAHVSLWLRKPEDKS